VFFLGGGFVLAAALIKSCQSRRRSPPAVFLWRPPAKLNDSYMIIVLKPGLSRTQERTVLKEIRKRGYRPHVMRGVSRTVIGAIGDELTHTSLETLAS